MSDKNRILNEDAIRERATDEMLTLIEDYTRLKKRGRVYFGKCPLHNENTGSFAVTPSKNIYKCFGCGKSGRHAIDFVMQAESKTYREALEWVADYFKITVEYSDSTLQQGPRKPIERKPRKPPEPPKPPSYMAPELMERTLRHYGSNTFINFLTNLFNINIVSDILSKYRIGTTKEGGVIFWQIDEANNIRGGKVLMYNPETGKRFKDKFNWVHTAMEIPDYNLVQSFFGEHLLALDTTSPVGIVESEKSACIASVHFPDFIFISCGGKGFFGDLITKKADALGGRDIVLFSDLAEILPEDEVREKAKKDPERYNLDIWEFDKGSAYNEWKHAAEALKPVVNSIRVSDILERNATEEDRASKLDLADYLIRVDYREVLYKRLADAYNRVESAAFYNFSDIESAARNYLRCMGQFDPFEIDKMIEKYTVYPQNSE